METSNGTGADSPETRALAENPRELANCRKIFGTGCRLGVASRFPAWLDSREASPSCASSWPVLSRWVPYGSVRYWLSGGGAEGRRHRGEGGGASESFPAIVWVSGTSWATTRCYSGTVIPRGRAGALSNASRGETWKYILAGGGVVGISDFVQAGIPKATAQELCSGWPNDRPLCGNF
jgi:hypothetical protein